MNISYLRLAILGGGPSALFLYKKLVESGHHNLEVDIYEKGSRVGAGMPYSADGANDEHITNVSGNEIPDIVTPVAEWICTMPKGTLDKYHIDAKNFNEYKTLPRLLFGDYLSDQFKMLLSQGKYAGLNTNVYYNTKVIDVKDDTESELVTIICDNGTKKQYDKVIICTGHLWPKKHEDKVQGYFDSPYPPSKLTFTANHRVAVRGSSLTAIDAIRTLARYNGYFSKDKNGVLSYRTKEDTPDFRIVMHSRNGLLPAMRFHLEDPSLGKSAVLSSEEVAKVKAQNHGFLPLDYVFERNFKDGIKINDPEYFEQIKDFTMEQFVEQVMELRERFDPFQLLAAEFDEAEKSIKRRKSIYWKEMLGILSFAMNHPAKYFSAEDMLRLQRVLMPLISVVIAYVPQSSAAEMLAMHKAGCLSMVAIGEDGEVEPLESGGIFYHYKNEKGQQCDVPFQTFVDCIGQPHLSYEQLPYPGLKENQTVSRARIYFRDAEAGQKELENGNNKIGEDSNGKLFLTVPGVAINDSFQVVDSYGALNDRIYIMAVPFIGGYNPDYSGLDFGDAASDAVVNALFDIKRSVA